MSREIFSQKKTYIKKSWTFGTVLSTCLISLDLVFTVSYWISIINLSSCHNQIYCIYLHDLYFLFHDAMHNFAFYLGNPQIYVLLFVICSARNIAAMGAWKVGSFYQYKSKSCNFLIWPFQVYHWKLSSLTFTS